MGGRAAAAIAAAGHPVIGFDPVSSARDRARSEGIDVTDSATQAVEGADVVVVSVPRPEHVLELARGALQASPRGAVVVDLSTIDPSTAQLAAELLAPHGIVYLDSPVLGRPAGVGSWTLVVGGEAESVERVTPLLESSVARRVVRVGESGAGSVVKLLNNLMFGAINAVTAEAMEICRRSGIDQRVFVDAVVDSGAATVSNLFRDIAPRLASGDDAPVFSLDLLAKDNLLAIQLARESRVDSPIADAVQAVNERAQRLGFGARDSIAVVRAYRDGEDDA
ncbi:3-hydroxyisobutyrate dehydrogenase [Agrococcus sp. BE272]|nr:3-hydroxyisobutyrate dehydrogenase [Agrococcus sp. BE272]